MINHGFNMKFRFKLYTRNITGGDITTNFYFFGEQTFTVVIY